MTAGKDDGAGNGGEAWSRWIVHDGKGCPLPGGTVVEIVSEDGFGFARREMATVSGESYSSWNWKYYPELKRIIRYRALRPRGLRMLQESLETPNETTRPAQTPAKPTVVKTGT
jgi:hypothetical protein